jgi:hypothetical protein
VASNREAFNHNLTTERADSTITTSTPLLEQKGKPAAQLERDLQPARSQRWNWQDALYLLVLVGLVMAMALLYTPDLTGEVPGKWWDPLLNIWTLSWDTNSLLHHPALLWQGQLLYPNLLTLSYSENLLGEVIFFAPVFLISNNPVLAYNVTFYLAFLLCGVNMYIAARHYTGKPLAAFVAALIYAFAPYRLAQIDHIHIVAGEWIPLAFLFLDLSLQRSRWHHWSLFILFYLLQLFSSIYYGIFLSYTLLAYVLIRYSWPFIKQLRQNRRAYIEQLMAQVVKPIAVFSAASIILFILLKPYLDTLHSGLARSTFESVGYSAFVRDFTFTAIFNRLYGISSYNGTIIVPDGEHFLFLGWTIMALTALGIVLAFWKHHSIMRNFAWTGLIVLLFAFGPYLQYSTNSGAPLLPTQSYNHPFAPAIPMPWLLAYYILPGFQGLRVPARLVGVLLMMLALLSAYTVSWLQEIVHAKSAGKQEIGAQPAVRPFKHFSFFALTIRCLLVALPLAILLESLPAYLPVTHVPVGNSIPPVYQWLASHGGTQPVVELPMAHLDENFTRKDEAWYDYYALYHDHPIVNGWSGYRPDLTTTISALLLNFPSSASLQILEKYHVEYVIFHPQLFLRYETPGTVNATLARMQTSSRLHFIAVFGSNLSSSDSLWQVT